jgi:competence protein ComEC
MPLVIATLVLMPLGAENLALVPLGWGIAAMNWVAEWVGGWPGARVVAPVLPGWGLAVFTLGGLWLCLWRGGWRLWGVPVMAAGLLPMALWHAPDILVDGRGQAFGVRGADGALLMSRGGRLAETWGSRAGPVTAERWPKQGRSADGRLSCDPDLCFYRTGARVVALVRDESGLDEACSGAEVVVSAVPVRESCPGARMVVDRFDLWRRGAHALWLEADGRVRVATVRAGQGERPWSLDPKPRPRPPRKSEPKPAKPEDEAAEDEE